MKQQDQAVAWVEEMGGLIFRGDDLDDDGQQILCFGIGQVEMPGHRVAAGFSVHSPVIRVDISDKHGRITDLTPLASLITLRTLNLSVRKVTDLSPIAKLTDLRQLGLYAPSVLDLSPIGTLAKLQELAPFSISAADLHFLVPLTALRKLNISNPEDCDLSPLQGLASLEVLTLVLGGRSITDLSPLNHLIALRELYLGGIAVSDLSPLARLPDLKELHLNDTKVTDDEVAKLRELLPTCKIVP